jgi:hypothetical protein
MRSQLVAFPDDPFVISHHLALERQGFDILCRQPEALALTEATGVGHQSSRPERLRNHRIPVFFRFDQLIKQAPAAFHDELEILDDQRLIGENPR